MIPAIEVHGVWRRYPPAVEALRGVNLTVDRGEFVALVGRSGSGKSTLLNILGGLDRPDEGTVGIAGVEVDYADGNALVALRRQTLGFVFQDFNLLPSLTAEENVAFPLLFNYQGAGERARRASTLLRTSGSPTVADHYPRAMSGGESSGSRWTGPSSPIGRCSNQTTQTGPWNLVLKVAFTKTRLR